MSLLEAIIIGIIQGLTEFLPVSSSGHIELAKAVLGVDMKEDNLLFSVIVHGATALSTIVVFRKVIWELIKDLFQFKWNESTKFIAQIALSMIPVGIIGVLFEEQIELFFTGQILLVGAMLLVTATLLFFTMKAPAESGGLNFFKALIIGLAQAISILPGISRSGATISTALLLGVNREMAARFSFLMVLPPILGATALKVKDYLELTATGTASTLGFDVLSAGFLAAFLAGLLACSWMIKIVKSSKLIYFAIYCLIVGLIAIISGIL